MRPMPRPPSSARGSRLRIRSCTRGKSGTAFAIHPDGPFMGMAIHCRGHTNYSLGAGSCPISGGSAGGGNRHGGASIHERNRSDHSLRAVRCRHGGRDDGILSRMRPLRVRGLLEPTRTAVLRMSPAASKALVHHARPHPPPLGSPPPRSDPRSRFPGAHVRFGLSAI